MKYFFFVAGYVTPIIARIFLFLIIELFILFFSLIFVFHYILWSETCLKMHKIQLNFMFVM